MLTAPAVGPRPGTAPPSIVLPNWVDRGGPCAEGGRRFPLQRSLPDGLTVPCLPACSLRTKPTVRATLHACCTADLYKEMRAREILQGIEPDPNLEKLWVAVATQKKKNPLVEV